MFRMEFQSLDAVEEDDDLSRSYRSDGGRGKSVWDEKYRHKASPPRIYEGQVGRFGRMQRTFSSNGTLTNGVRLPQVLTRSVSSDAAIPENWVEVDLIDFGSPKAVEEPVTVDQDVLRELVRPFAESVNLTHQPSGKRIDSDVFVTFLEYQPERSRDLLSDRMEYGSFRNIESLQTRSSSMRSNGSTSWSDSSDAEGSSFYAERAHIKNEDKGSPAARAYNRAFNKLMHKKSKPTVPDAVSTAFSYSYFNYHVGLG